MGETARKAGAKVTLTGVNLNAGKQLLAYLNVYGEPEDIRQRQAFEELLPDIYALRNKGFSWDQIASALHEVGFKLQSSTVRVYFTEMIGSRLDMCQKSMNEQILVMERIRQEISNPLGESALKEAVEGQNQRGFMAIQGTVEKLKAKRSGPCQALPAVARPGRPVLAPAENERQVKADEPAQQTESPDNFGLSQIGGQEKRTAQKPAFFDLEDSPAVPEIEPKQEGRVASPCTLTAQFNAPPVEKLAATPALTCGPLRSEVKPLALRPNNPAHIYCSGALEHPAIPGLMLSLDQRLYGTSLEITDALGTVRLETTLEKTLRNNWKKPIPITPSATSASFVEMDMSLFKKA